MKWNAASMDSRSRNRDSNLDPTDRLVASAVARSIHPSIRRNVRVKALQSVTSIPSVRVGIEDGDCERRRGTGSNPFFGSPSSGVVLHLRPENGIAVRETEASRESGRASWFPRGMWRVGGDGGCDGEMRR